MSLSLEAMANTATGVGRLARAMSWGASFYMPSPSDERVILHFTLHNPVWKSDQDDTLADTSLYDVKGPDGYEGLTTIALACSMYGADTPVIFAISN